ncbi:MAG: hypothetical protein VSS75_028955 [Candidatus Parabeggiatoa sp.]|nr:hypothetical protein [Candidatus Parabeggiatoa sp.]
MNKIFLSAVGISLLTALHIGYADIGYAGENPNSHAVKAPPTQVKAPPDNAKSAPRTNRDNEDTQSTQQAQPCKGISSDVKVDSRVQAFLGCEIIQILAQPERVESFRVKAKPNPSLPQKNRLGNYPIEENGQGINLTQVEIKDLHKLFFSEKSYYFEASKRCRFLPEMGFHFVKNEQSVEVLFSFSCNLWLFFYKGEEKLEDFDYVQEPLLKLGKSLFSKEGSGTN